MADHTQKERDPPPRPLDLEFPGYVPPYSPTKLNASSSSQVRERICHIRSFTEISDQDLSYFNLDFRHNVELASLLPGDKFQERPFLFDEDLDSMLTEISYDNQDAFREILRMEPRNGRSKPRLAYARNFFGSLEDMARYWDTSLDSYYSIPNDGAESRPPPGTGESTDTPSLSTNAAKQADGSDLEMTDVSTRSSESSKESNLPGEKKEVYKGYRFGNGEQVNPGTRVAMVKNLLKMVTHKFVCRDHEPMPAPREKLVIRGVRVQSIQYQFCIARVPRDTKLARARMVEGPIMAAHVREEVKFKQTPRLAAAEALLTGSTPADGTGGQPTKPVTPKSAASSHNFVGERFDLLREIGCMLILATQRAREGKDKDTFSGADKWWVTKQRWGGGPTKWGQLASEVYEDEDPSWSPEEKRLQEEKRQRAQEDRARSKSATAIVESSAIRIDIDNMMANNAPTIPSLPGDPLAGPRKKKLRSIDRPLGKEEEMREGRRLMYVPPYRKKWYQDWQRLRPNTPIWDDKIVYRHIGKLGGSDFDDIFMVTSVNHHVALLRMKVHQQYLEWLETGAEVVEEVVESLRKDVLHVQRSTWFNMFDIQDRREFLIALWRLMCWLNREHVDQDEYNKMQRKA